MEKELEIMTLALLLPPQRAFPTPAFNLGRDIADRGWSITAGWVQSGHLAQADAWKKQIVLPDDFTDRLTHPELAREVAHWQLAHELAHLVLHLDFVLKGYRTDAMERAASDWALSYLVPESILRDRISRGVERAAEWFSVPQVVVQAALRRYGIITGEGFIYPRIREMVAA